MSINSQGISAFTFLGYHETAEDLRGITPIYQHSRLLVTGPPKELINKEIPLIERDPKSHQLRVFKQESSELSYLVVVVFDGLSKNGHACFDVEVSHHKFRRVGAEEMVFNSFGNNVIEFISRCKEHSITQYIELLEGSNTSKVVDKYPV